MFPTLNFQGTMFVLKCVFSSGPARGETENTPFYGALLDSTCHHLGLRVCGWLRDKTTDPEPKRKKHMLRFECVFWKSKRQLLENIPNSLGVLQREFKHDHKSLAGAIYRHRLVTEECIRELKYLFPLFLLQRAQMYWKICQCANDSCFDWTTFAWAEFAHQNKRHKGFMYP